MASIAHEPYSQCSSMTCVYYPKIHRVQRPPMEKLRPSQEDYELLFPPFCSQCSTLQITKDELCTFCRHLCLQHFFYCVSDQETSLAVYLVLGRLADLQLRLGCHFCTFIVEVVQRESQIFPDNINGSDLLVLSLWSIRGGLKSLFATSSFDPRSATVEVFIGSGCTSIDSFTDDDYSCIQRGVNPDLAVRRRKPPDESKTMGEIVDWQRLITWIKECTDHHIHDDPVLPPGEKVLESLLFIDVEQGCIVSGSCSCNYIALSYVWGDHTAGMAQTTKQSIDHLRKPGSLMGHCIPATIRDAMVVCRVLGVRYLWVDRFCIVQDDQFQKHEQIRSMGMIYSCALLTICATAGDNADYGLPGVLSRPRAQVRPRTFAFGVEIIPVRPIDRSTWSSRGWTYQEMVLSRRRLMFNHEEVFFECNQGAAAEVSTPLESPMPDLSLDGLRSSTKINNYMIHVRKYAERNLSYKSDVFNAFAGVCDTIYPSKDLIHGLPTSAFDEAILWEIFREKPDRWPRQSLEKDFYIPSWSWGSELGQEVAYSENFRILGSFAKWSFVEQEQVRVIESVDTPMSWSSLSYRSCYDPRLYLALAWREHVIESAPSFTISWDRPFEKIESYVIKGWPAYRDYWGEAHGRSQIETNVQTVGRLLLRTSVAMFRLGTPKWIFPSVSKLTCAVYSDDNFPCGWVDLPPIAIEKEMPKAVNSFLESGRRKIQLVALSCVHFEGSHVEKLFKAHASGSIRYGFKRYGYIVALTTTMRD